MADRPRIALAAGGSLVLLLGALAFQYLGGLAPCPLCIWQRWPHVIAVALGVSALLLVGGRKLVAALGVVVMLAGAGIGLYHTGIERGWWRGPDSCSGSGSLANPGAGALLDMDRPLNVVMCNEVAWSLFGISMAGWNTLGSLALAAVWLSMVVRPGRTR